MGSAFSGPNAFKGFHFTPKATAVLQANPFLFVTIILVLLGCIGLGLVAWYIHFVTNKVYKKPKAAGAVKGAPRK